MSFKFKFSKKNEVLKEINVEALSLEDYFEYRKTLKSLQKNVNEYLTSLVAEESALIEPEKEDNFQESDSDSEKEKSPKRALSDDRAPRRAKAKKC